MGARRDDSGQIFKGVKKIKSRGRISDFPKAINTINSKLSDFFHYIPRNLSDIDNVVRLKGDDFFNELVWQCNVM